MNRADLVRVAHTVATHGQPAHEREYVVAQWERHLADAADAGDSTASQISEVLRSCFTHTLDRAWHGTPTVLPLGGVLLLGASAELLFALTDSDHNLTNAFELLFGTALACISILLISQPQTFHPRLMAAAMAFAGVTAPLVAPGVATVSLTDHMVRVGCVFLGIGPLITAGILIFSDQKRIPTWWWWPLRIAGAGAFALGLANSMRAGMDRNTAGMIATLIAAIAGVWGVVVVERFGLLQAQETE